MNMRPRIRVLIPATLLLVLALPVSPATARERLELRHTGLELPAAPSVIVPADMDGDGVQDLAVVLAYSEWDRITVDEQTRMEGIDHLVTVLTVVPTLIDRRELRVYLGRPEGGFDSRVPPLPLDLSILSVGPGPAGYPVIAVTDEGLSRIVLQAGDEGEAVVLEPLLARRPLTAFSGALVPGLARAEDVDGDGRKDLLFPAPEGIAIYLAGEDGLSREPSAVVEIPGRAWRAPRYDVRDYPFPQVHDVSGDGLPDLVVPDQVHGWDRFLLYLNLGGGRFTEGRIPHDRSDDSKTKVVHFGDLDGDGTAEYVIREALEVPGDGMRAGMKEAKRPPMRVRLHSADDGLRMVEEPFHTFEAEGYAFDTDDDEIRLPGGFQDLDGDGRQDLVALTLDFSLMQVLRIVTTQSLKIGLDFHVWCQDGEGSFRPVEGLDLSGKFKINLKNFRLGQLSQFAGDFDGDGKADFLQIGRGRSATIHRGSQGCRYPAEPDLKVPLVEPPLDLTLVRVTDANDDGLADILIIQPQQPDPRRDTPPVRLDLYLSGGGE